MSLAFLKNKNIVNHKSIMTLRLVFAILTLPVVALVSCQKKIETFDSFGPVEAMTSPAGSNSSVPNFHLGIDGDLYLSWIETGEEDSAVMFYSTIKNGKWTPSIKVAEGCRLLVNWADFPSLSTFGNGSLAAHYLVKTSDESFAYNINLSISNDNGVSWSEPLTPHSDTTVTEHGFVSLLPYGENVLAMWLDGRNYELIKEGDTSPSDEMMLRSAVIDGEGKVIEEILIDDRVCSCCQTDAAISSTGPILVYRDRSGREIRDISIVRLVDGKWTKAQSVSQDHWQIAGCPVNGPAIAAQNDLVVVAWFTASNNVPKVKVVFSGNGGEKFDEAILISGANPAGRVDVITLNDNSAMISWLEALGDETVIKACLVHRDGSLGESMAVAKTNVSRSSGFPKMSKLGNTVYFAWTEVGEKLTVKTASMTW